MSTARLILAAGGAAALASRPRVRNWGATLRERTRILPGDGLIPGERGVSTTIHASPAAGIR